MHIFISNNIPMAMCILLQCGNLLSYNSFILIKVHEVIEEEMDPKPLHTCTSQPVNVLAIVVTFLITHLHSISLQAEVNVMKCTQR